MCLAKLVAVGAHDIGDFQNRPHGEKDFRFPRAGVRRERCRKRLFQIGGGGRAPLRRETRGRYPRTCMVNVFQNRISCILGQR